MAHTVPMITPGSIIVDRGLVEHPVYFVRVNGVDLVIKGDAKGRGDRTDAETEISIKWSSKLMKRVNNPLVNTKIMNPAEVNVFLQVAAAAMPNPSKQHNYVTAAAQMFTWTKMPRVPGLSDADFNLRNERGFISGVSTQKVKEVIVKLTDEAMWPPLGKILAVDIFNGNNDRFDTETGEWTNFGNLMFLQGGATSVIGLDTFDPNNASSNLAQVGGFDALRTLIDPGRQLTFARACVTSVGAKLSQALREGGLTNTNIRVNGPGGPVIWNVIADEVKDFYLDFDRALAAGISAGAIQLRDHLRQKVRIYRTKAGMPAVPPPQGPAAVGGRQRVLAGVAAAPPRPMAATLHATAVPGIPHGIHERMAYLNWLE